MSFEIVANYQYKGYSLPSTANNDLVPAVSGNSYYYPSDVDIVVATGEEWTPVTFASFSSNDDGVSSDTRDLGFSWGWKDRYGQAYSTTKWYLNTNGKMCFGDTPTYDGTISPSGQTEGICAQPGDMWFQPGYTNITDPGVYTSQTYPSWNATGNNTYNDLTVAQLQTQYGIVAERWNGVYTRFRFVGNGMYNVRLETLGYIDTSNVYHAQNTTDYLYQIENNKYSYSAGPNFAGMGTAFSFPLKSYNVNTDNGITAVIPFDNLSKIRVLYFGTEKASGAPHGVWEYKKSWVDNGITHNIYRLVVYCSSYGDRTKDHSYRISLYKAGASQKFSISLASDSSLRTGNTNAGPYPHSGSDSTLKTSLNWLEQSWYSEDSGYTWYRYKPQSPEITYSTITHMSPAAIDTTFSTDIRLQAMYTALKYNATIYPYGGSTVTSTFYARYYSYQYGFKAKMAESLLRHLNYVNFVGPGNNPYEARNTTESYLYSVFSSQYVLVGGKTPVYAYYRDINQSQSFTLDDYYSLSGAVGYTGTIGGGFAPGVAKLRDKLISDCDINASNTGTDTLIKTLIATDYLFQEGNSWSAPWDEKLILPGVRGVPPVKANLNLSMYNFLGAISTRQLRPITTTYVVEHAVTNADWHYT